MPVLVTAPDSLVLKSGADTFIGINHVHSINYRPAVQFHRDFSPGWDCGPGTCHDRHILKKIKVSTTDMFFFYHLLTGIILGFLIADFLRDGRWIIPCIIGAVLPDLIDKPLGYLIFPSMDLGGRFLFHNFLVFLLILAIGILVWKYYTSPVFIALAVGILSHQILDSMWKAPVYWLYPLYGPYPVHAAIASDYIYDLLGSDLFNPSEWVFIVIGIGALFLYWKRDSLAGVAARHKKLSGSLLKCTEVALWVMYGIVLVCGLLKIPFRYLAIFQPDQYAFTLVIIALAAILVIRWEKALENINAAPHHEPVTDRPGPLVREFDSNKDMIKEANPASQAKGNEMAARSGLADNRSLQTMALGHLYIIGAVTAAGCILLFVAGNAFPRGVMVVIGAIAAGFLAVYGALTKNGD
jgi:voltage-gated potassium channel Kch